MRFTPICRALCSALAVTGIGFAPTLLAADLKIAVAADVTSIDPHFFNLFPNNNIAEHIFDKLVQMDPDSRIIPGLATSWKTVDDKTWEFKLRKGVKFTDGSELTAEDVVFSIDRVPTVPNSPGPFSAYTKAIIAKEIVDPYTIRFKYAAPYPLAPNDLSTIYIVSKKRQPAPPPRTSIPARRPSAAGATSSSSTAPATGSSSPATTTTGAISRPGRRSRSRSSRTSRRASPRCCRATSRRSSSRRPRICPASRPTRSSR